jgi:hypothetical protein
MHTIVAVPPWGQFVIVDDVLAIVLLNAPCSLLRHEINDGIKSRGDLSVLALLAMILTLPCQS